MLQARTPEPQKSSQSALTGLKAGILLVDDVNTATAAHNTASRVPILESLEGCDDLHGLFLSCKQLFDEKDVAIYPAKHALSTEFVGKSQKTAKNPTSPLCFLPCRHQEPQKNPKPLLASESIKKSATFMSIYLFYN
ncbi:MAG: hypothetical protein A2018_00650 [Alphaproteobacteria bacterium GWF2_58_20]|nr:MAG: hypothetical protein A2018_00650 [Alphaproteobacteria bacterium GWF2_58_20]